MSEHIPDQVEDIDDDRPTPKLDALVNEQTDLFQDPDTTRFWGSGQIRERDDLSPYISGPADLPPNERITHQVEKMLGYAVHWDRVMWAIKTTRGRIIVVMQQRHDADPNRVGHEIELINAPFRETAVKVLRQDIEMIQYILGLVSQDRGI